MERHVKEKCKERVRPQQIRNRPFFSHEDDGDDKRVSESAGLKTKSNSNGLCKNSRDNEKQPRGIVSKVQMNVLPRISISLFKIFLI